MVLLFLPLAIVATETLDVAIIQFNALIVL